jgi:hypothetical protein
MRMQHMISWKLRSVFDYEGVSGFWQFPKILIVGFRNCLMRELIDESLDSKFKFWIEGGNPDYDRLLEEASCYLTDRPHELNFWTNFMVNEYSDYFNEKEKQFLINLPIHLDKLETENYLSENKKRTFKIVYDEIKDINEYLKTLENTDTQGGVRKPKQKPEQNGKLITLKNSETIEKVHSELKGYFPKKEAELLKALQGEQSSELLLFPHNQNKFVEVFRRLKYNGFLLNNDTQTKNWICTTFQFVKKGFSEPQPFNESTVWDNLNKGKGEPTKKERICITEWLPYKSPEQLTRETKNEKL